MIKVGNGYKAFNIKHGTDKNGKKYTKFSISDSKKKPNSDDWHNTWWNVTTYSNIDLKDRDVITLAEITGAEVDIWNGEARGTMFASVRICDKKVEKDKTAEKKNDSWAKGEDMGGHQEAFTVGDEELPF